jgi:hypothetical protein
LVFNLNVSNFCRSVSGDLVSSKFEIIVTLIGVTEETGNTIQVTHFRHELYATSFPVLIYV